MERYYFKFKNRLLADIVYDGVCFHVDKVYESNRLLYMLNDFNRWIDNRQTLISRRNALDLLKTADIHSDRDFVDITMCLSIQDCFWVTKNRNMLWSSVSLFRNPFHRVFTDIAMCKNGFTGSIVKTPSPELTIGGSSMKWCKKVNKDILFFKSFGGMAELEYSGCYAEYFVSQLGKYLGIDILDYRLSEVNNILCSVSTCYTSEQVSEIYVGNLCDDARHLDTHIHKYRGRLGKQFRDLLILDCLVYNVDRHDENIGLLYDENFNVMTLSPAYDFDHSLFYDLSLEGRSIDYVDEKVKSYVPKTYNDHTFLDQFKMCIYPELYSKLKIAYDNFEFSNYSKKPISRERLHKINYLFKRNLGRLLRYGV